jgi:DNA repair protein RecN (Recombination protein N)
MLDEITVSNLGLIEGASLVIGDGLTVVSGETGTGKTLMLGALRLLRGDHATKDVIGPHGNVTDVSALVTIDGDDIVVRRTVDQSRSKAYLDGQISPAKVLTESLAEHIAIVGQHDQHLITNARGVRSLVDRCLDAEGRSTLSRYRDAWTTYSDISNLLDELGGDTRVLERDLETLRFQIKEIDDAGFVAGDEERLRTRAARLRSAVELGDELNTALSSLNSESVNDSLATAIHAVERAARIDVSLHESLGQAKDVASLLGDVVADLSRYAADLSNEGEELPSLESRLADLGQLKRKYGDTVEDILTFRKDADAEITRVADLISRATDLDAAMSAAESALADAGTALRFARDHAAGRLARAAVEHLKDLGFSDPLVEIAVTGREPTATGADHLEILFASDNTLNPAPISAVASGGELSRLVLALTVGAGGAEAAVVAFDEIDAGVGGMTALAMGEKLAALARGRQVICVTHLPQVAAYGDHHFVVSRVKTTTTVEAVFGNDRVKEISRMLAGLGDSDTGQKHAEELLSRAATGTTGTA